MNFRVATINARGLATRERSLVLCHLLKQHQVDIAFVQKTNISYLDHAQDLCLGYGAAVTRSVAISGSGHACLFGPGIAILRQRVLGPGHITLAVSVVHGQEMAFINVHLSHNPHERLEKLELIAVTAIQEEAWVLGDFNIREDRKISSDSLDALTSLQDLATLVDAATLFDAAHLPTRVASHGERIESNRLDRILVPAGFLDRVNSHTTTHYHLSDHRALLLQPCIAALLRSGLEQKHLAGYIRDLEENISDLEDVAIWERWTGIKARLLAEARSLHVSRAAVADDGYVARARRYIAAQLEASSVKADYPTLPNIVRVMNSRRQAIIIRDDDGRFIEGPELRQKAFEVFRPRFARATCDPAEGAAFIRGTTTSIELDEDDPLHRTDVSAAEVAIAIRHLPRGRAPGWDGLPCELLATYEEIFTDALSHVFAASQLRGALPPSMRRNAICLIPKARSSRGLDGYRPISLPSVDYRVASILLRRYKPHLPALVPESQTYAVLGRSPSWNISRITDAVEAAIAGGSPLAVVGVDLETAFDSLDRGFLLSLMLSLRLPPAFGCSVSAAALFSIATGRLLRRLEMILGVGNAIAYADDIAHLVHRDERFVEVLEDGLKAIDKEVGGARHIFQLTRKNGHVLQLKAGVYGYTDDRRDADIKTKGDTVPSFLTFGIRWLEQGNVAIYRNAGATRVTSARVDRRILRQAVAAPQATCTAILQHVQDTLDHSISTRTISRRLVANGLHSCRPLRRLPLTPPNRRQRLEWCRARSTWMTEWHRVVFSDESRFCLSSDSRRVRVWRRRGERSNPAAIVERPTVRQRGIMVWGAIAYDSRSPLLRIQGTMTAQRYVDDVLRPVTLPYLQGLPNALYQQDNARPHTARISQQALQDVQMLPWPPYSPDLSPIEHVWDIIGRRLHALPQPRSEDELWQMVEREWRAIPQDAIRTLIDSLPRRVAACIAVRGGPTCY
ncbi:Transposase [Cordylochernes scorpioides]|uniref:Transposase n=1 Tax=Cordylochernes scorpioides TaxID=51811 RepID=A0ABY6KPI9_9ARAC|nr:Transposase [Cordylochernes scorpioides]